MSASDARDPLWTNTGRAPRHAGASRVIARILRTLLPIAVMGVGSGAIAKSDRDVFFARHRCTVVSLLDQIHRKCPIHTSRHRFIALSRKDIPDRYTQCIFIDDDTAMYCEASSGAYRKARQDDGRYDLPPEVIAALHRLGYRQEEPTANFSRHVALGPETNVEGAATSMLEVLFDAFGARSDTPLAIDAPQGDGADAECGALAGMRARRSPYWEAST